MFGLYAVRCPRKFTSGRSASELLVDVGGIMLGRLVEAGEEGRSWSIHKLVKVRDVTLRRSESGFAVVGEVSRRRSGLWFVVAREVSRERSVLWLVVVGEVATDNDGGRKQESDEQTKDHRWCWMQ